jgi:hypothetical protein
LFDAPGDGGDDVGVGCKRKMGAMLLERAERKEDDFTRQLEALDLGPGKIFQEHS